MAFPDTLLAAASTWFSNVLVDAARIQANLTDNLNTLATRVTSIGQGGLGAGTSSSSSITLATAATDVAGLATFTYTLATQRRVKVTVVARYLLATTTNGRMALSAGYNTGASAVIGSVVKVGGVVSTPNFTATAGANGGTTGVAVGDVLLAAGQYTFYAAVQRASGGSTTDTATSFYTLVEDIGSV